MDDRIDQILPAPDVLNHLDYGKFVLTNLAAKRAKQIKEGAPPLVRIDSSHPLTIALAEIAQGKIRPMLAAELREREAEEAAALEADSLDDVGLLLPAFEDDEDGDGPKEIDLDDLEDMSDDDDDDDAPVKASSSDDDDEDDTSDDDSEISLEDLARDEDSDGDDDES